MPGKCAQKLPVEEQVKTSVRKAGNKPTWSPQLGQITITREGGTRWPKGQGRSGVLMTSLLYNHPFHLQNQNSHGLACPSNALSDHMGPSCSLAILLAHWISNWPIWWCFTHHMYCWPNWCPDGLIMSSLMPWPPTWYPCLSDALQIFIWYLYRCIC